MRGDVVNLYIRGSGRMRKIIVIEHITLDGIIQSPGSKEEDGSNGFNNGGWISDYSDEVLGTEIRNIMNSNFDLLLGGKTYRIWSDYWPYHNDVWPNSNLAHKYIVSKSISKSLWKETTFIRKNIIEEISKLKEMNGNDLHVWGSSFLVKDLLEFDLLDRLKLFIYPVILGSGKTVFGKCSSIKNFNLISSINTQSGINIVEYCRN